MRQRIDLTKIVADLLNKFALLPQMPIDLCANYIWVLHNYTFTVQDI